MSEDEKKTEILEFERLSKENYERDLQSVSIVFMDEYKSEIMKIFGGEK